MIKTLLHTASGAHRRLALAAAPAAALAMLAPAQPALAQALTVLPVSIQMSPGQMATELRVINMGATQTSIQVRAYAWTQVKGVDVLTASNDVVASPPITTIPASTTQVVRLVLRRPPTGHEQAYRILLDQVPPPEVPGTVRIALRLSIPIFAEPATRAEPHVAFHVENGPTGGYLIAVNDGGRHDTIRDIKLATADGAPLSMENGSPYVLSGATRSWPISDTSSLPASGAGLRLNARADSGVLVQPVAVTAVR
jgi:fimbrial chaperone protein